jgi:hypothetical protein
MTQDEEMLLRELAAEQCVIPKVTARLGPMSLWSNDALKEEIRRAVEAEREACAKVAMEFRRGAGDAVCGDVATAIQNRGEA